MAWTTPITWVAGNTLTAQQMNQQVRDNLNETAPAKAAVEGRLLVTSGANSIVERDPRENGVAASESTTSDAYTDLTTVGPAITVTTGTRAIVVVTSFIRSDTADQGGAMSYEVSGASSIAASDGNSLQLRSPGLTAGAQKASRLNLQASLTAGSNTFTAKYKRVGTGTATFSGRTFTIIPL